MFKYAIISAFTIINLAFSAASASQAATPPDSDATAICAAEAASHCRLITDVSVWSRCKRLRYELCMNRYATTVMAH